MSSRPKPKPVLFQDHDGSWTWSLEIGEVFEDGYELVARNEGYPTRADAKEAMVEALARYNESQAAPSATSAPAPPEPEPVKPPPAKPEPAASKKKQKKKARKPGPAPAAGPPDWAVIVEGRIVALFLDAEQARAFGHSVYQGQHAVERIRYSVALEPAQSNE